MHLKRLAALAILIPILSACVSGGGPRSEAPPPDEEQLNTRPIERWNHLIGKRADLAWDFFSPGYRSTRNKDEYVAEMLTRTVTWLGVEYDSHKCHDEGIFCEVNLKVFFKVRSRQVGVGDIESHGYVTERWIKSGDFWYYVPESISG